MISSKLMISTGKSYPAHKIASGKNVYLIKFFFLVVMNDYFQKCNTFFVHSVTQSSILLKKNHFETPKR